MNNYLVGVDVGSSKICAAMGKIDNYGNFHLLGVTSVKCLGLKKSVVIDIESTAESIKDCLLKLEGMTGVTVDGVYLSFPAGLCELHSTKGIVAISSENKEITSKDVERVINATKNLSISSDKEIVAIIPKVYAVDGYTNIKNPIGMAGIRLEVDATAFITESKAITNLLKSVTLAGFKVHDITIQAIAQASIALNEDDNKMFYAIVDVGADTIDLCVYQGGNICYTNIIPFGGNNISSDISQCFKISIGDAEKLKVMYGDVKILEENDESIQIQSAYDDCLTIQKSLLVEVINARVEELLSFVLEEMKKSGYYNSISAVILTGGGVAMFNSIADFGKEILQKSIRISSPQYVGTTNATYSAAVGVIKNIYDSLRIDEGLESYNTELKENRKSKQNKSNKVISKIRELIEEFF